MHSHRTIFVRMTAPAEAALKLQRPLPNGAVRVVMTGEKEDKA